MKFGFRTPSLKKRISARTSLKRVVRHRMGIKAPKGMGILTNPKKAVYNKVYRKTTIGIDDIAKSGKKKKTSVPEMTMPVSSSKSYPVLDRHFELSESIPELYKRREEEGLEKTIEACNQQIGLALQAKTAFLEQYPWQPLPSHTGYEKLTIILDKQGRYQEAIKVCVQAEAEGWAGDWDKRIGRCQAKLNK